MCHAILVKALNANGASHPEILAYDIANADTANYLVKSIACSYPVHGHYADSGRLWFVDMTGYHEIWAEAA
jgi:hypothetical protein